MIDKTNIIYNFFMTLTENTKEMVFKEVLMNDERLKKSIKTREDIIKILNEEIDRNEKNKNKIERSIKIESINRNLKSYEINEAAREITRRGFVIGCRTLYKKLHDFGLIYKQNTSCYKPSLEMKDKGFMIEEKRANIKYSGNANKYSVVLITDKGINYIQSLLEGEFDRCSV